MQTIESLKRQLDTTETLQSVVKTMKSLAASNIRQYERAVESLEDYTRAVNLGLLALLLDAPAGGEDPKRSAEGPLAAMVFGSDQGLCGRINDAVAERMEQDMRGKEAPAAVIAVGERVAGRLRDAGFDVDRIIGVPGSAEGITARVEELLLLIDELRGQSRAGRVTAWFNKHESGTAFSPHSVRIYPLDTARLREAENGAWPTRMIPEFSMSRERLFAALVRQHIFINLFRAFAQSLASENASRLVSMQGAEKNIDERMGELTTLYNQQRQKAITEELLDIISGFTAIQNT